MLSQFPLLLSLTLTSSDFAVQANVSGRDSADDANLDSIYFMCFVLCTNCQGLRFQLGQYEVLLTHRTGAFALAGGFRFWVETLRGFYNFAEAIIQSQGMPLFS